ncbi:hypothetical protein ACW4TU_00375 [Streptomyces sp. QTS52]
MTVLPTPWWAARCGDHALEVEPMRESGGQERSDGLFTVKDSLFPMAEDIGLSYAMVDAARWAASKWPKDHRISAVSFTVHKILTHRRQRGTVHHDHQPARGQGPVDAGLVGLR